MRIYVSAVVAASLLAAACQQNASAQSSRTNSLGGTMSSGRASAGSGASFGSRSGSGSRSGLGSSGGFGASTTGQIQGNERFVRGSRQAGDFVGAGGNSSGGTTGFVGSQAAGARAARSGGNRGLSSLANRGGNQPNQSSRNSRDSIRARVSLGFKVVRPAAVDVVPRLHVQLAKIIQPKAGSPIQIEVDRGTATLRGAVASAHDRVIAERLALLEGGISKVKNELTVLEISSPPPPK